MQDRNFDTTHGTPALSGSFWTAWALILRRWKLIAALALLAGALAAAVVVLMPRSWPGQATIEIGKYKKAPGAVAPGSEQIESAAQIVGLFGDLEFKRQLVKQLRPGLIRDGTDIDLLLRRLTVMPGSGGNAVHVAFAGASPELTRALLEISSQAVLTRHESLMKQLDRSVEAYRTAVIEELVILEKMVASGGAAAAPGNVANTIVQSQQALTFTGRILVLRGEKFAAENYARLPTVPTRLSSPVWISARPLGIGGTLITLIALVGGTIAGIVFALLAVPPATGTAHVEQSLRATNPGETAAR